MLKTVGTVALVLALGAGPAGPGFAADLDFTGKWYTSTDKGWHYTVQLQQTGDKVIGGYVSQEDGHTADIQGVVKRRRLKFTWSTGKFKGTGVFTLSEDGMSINGEYRTEPHPELPAAYLTGSWSGTRGGDANAAKPFQ